MYTELLAYTLAPGVETFSTRRDSVLPYPVIQGHQVHDCKVAVVDRSPGSTPTPTPPFSRHAGKGSNAEGSSIQSG